MITCTCQTDSEDAILFCFCRGTVCYLLAVDLYLPVWENSDGRPGSYILNCLNIVIYGAQNLTVYASTKVHEFSEHNLLFQSFVHHTCKFFNICNSYIIYTKWYYLHWAGYIFISGNINMIYWSVSFLQYDNFGISRNYTELC